MTDAGERLRDALTARPPGEAPWLAMRRAHDLLRLEIARRLGADPADDSDPRANAVIAAALVCVEAALTAWTSNAQPQPLSTILDRAMGAPSHLE